MVLQIIIWSGILIACLAVLSKSADIFTENSEKIGLAFGLSTFVVGATIVAVGTSLPELMSSLFAVWAPGGNTEFVADNIVGSNIANVLLIFGIGALIAKKGGLKITTSLIDVDLPFFFLSMGLFTFFAMDKQISRGEGLFLLLFFIVFLIYSMRSGSTRKEKEEDKEEMADIKKAFRPHRRDIAKYVLFIVGSGALVALSAKYVVTSVLMLSAFAGLSTSVLTVLLVALGTSLPEVVTSVAAIRRGNHGMAIGNVLGSNTFNLLLVGGLPALFSHLAISGLVFTMALPFLVVVTLAAIFALFDDEIRFWEGAALLFMYIVFLAKTVQII